VIHGSALVGSLFTAWSNTYWSNAVEAEVYAIASFVMGLTTLLALRWARDPKSPQSTRNIYLIIYLLSLCVGFHLGTVLVYPSVALFILLYRNKSVTDADVVIFSCGFLLFLLYVTTILKGGLAAVAVIVYLIVAIWRLAGGKRFVAVASLLFLLGITIHAFLLIRSAQNPAIDEADPQTFANLMAVLRREQYPPSNPFHRKGSWEFQIVDHFWRYFTEQYQLVRPPRGTGMALVPILVGLAGLVALARRSFRSFALLGSTFFITSIGMILFLNFSDGTRLDPRSGSVIPAEVRERDYFYSPAFYFFGVFIGIGLAALLDWFFAARKNQKLARWDRLGYTGGVALFLVFTCMLYVRYHFQHDRTRERIPWGYGYNMLVGLEPNALIFTNGDNDTFPLWYMQQVEKVRAQILKVKERRIVALRTNIESGHYSVEAEQVAEKIMKEFGANPKGINGKVKPLQQTREEPEGGSTDVGDVSYLVPEITLYTTTAPFEAPDHSWVIVACSGMSIGEKGMLYSAKALGITMVDLFENEQLRKDIRTEFEKRRGTEKWKALLPE
jgi:hypothetical protein